jgi:hypothetical protein
MYKTVEIQSERLTRMSGSVSLRRDVTTYSHSKEDDYNEALKAFLT